MTRHRLLAVLSTVLFFGACERCGDKAAVDAGVPDSGPIAQVPKGYLPATDLRSALILIYPEFRGARIEGGRALLTRTVDWRGEGSLEQALSASLKQRGFTDVKTEGDTLSAKTGPFEFAARREGDTVLLQLWLPLVEEHVGKLLHSPAPLGTEHLGNMLPSLEGAKNPREVFTMELRYRAYKPDRATFLIRQVVEGLMTVGWAPTKPLEGWQDRKPDGGVGDIPSPLNVTIVNADSGGSLNVDRDEAKVTLTYVQPLGK